MFHPSYYELKIVQTLAEVEEVAELIMKSKLCWFDTETTGLRVRHPGLVHLVGYTFAVEDEVDERVFYIPVGHMFEGKYGPRNIMENLKLQQKDFPDFDESILDGEYYNLDAEEVNKILFPVFHSYCGTWIAHNIGYDMHVLANEGVDIDLFFRHKVFGERNTSIFDTMVASHLVNEEMEKKLESIIEKIYGLKKTDYSDVVATVTATEKKEVGLKSNNKASFQHTQIPIGGRYSAEDVWFMKQLYFDLLEELEKEEQTDIFYRMKMPYVKDLWDMERTGVKVDEKRLDEMTEKAKIELDNFQYQLYELAGVEFNINSGQQVAEILFGHKKQLKDKKTGEYKDSYNQNLVEKSFGFPVLNWTDGGKDKDKKLRNPQTNAETIDELLKLEPKNEKQIRGKEFLKLLQKFNRLEKLYSAFMLGMRENLYSDGKIHPSFNIAGCLTGDALIPTSNGMINIKHICKDLFLDGQYADRKLEIINKFGERESTSKIVLYKNREVRRISTVLGLNISGTLNHPLLVSSYSKQDRMKDRDRCITKKKVVHNSEWKQIQDIQLGDLVGVRYGYNMFSPTYISLDTSKCYISTNTNCKSVKLPNIVDENLAEFLGMCYADVSLKEGNGSFSLEFSNSNTDARKRFIELAEFLFKTKCNYDAVNSDKAITVTGISFRDYFLDVLDIKRGCVNKVIPHYILCSPLSVVKSFIRGMTLDSCVINERDKKFYLKYTVSNRESASTLQQILLNIGIISTVTQDKSKTDNVFNVKCYNEEYEKFKSVVGFIESCKNIVCTVVSSRHNYTIDYANKILWLSVSKIESGKEDVFDFVVPKTHSFLANSFISHNTDTRRLSCDSINLQQLPRPLEGDEEDYDFWIQFEIRSLFIADTEDECIIASDFGALEKCLTAEFTKDEALIDLIVNNYDAHGFTARIIFDECREFHPNEIKKKFPHLRQIAKTVGFAIDYGGTEFTVSRNLGIDKKLARQYIDNYFNGFRGIAEWGTKQIMFGRKYGYVTTLLGQRRHLSGIQSSNQAISGYYERVCKNFPVQGSASEVATLAQMKLNTDPVLRSLGVKTIMQVHDELVLTCPAKFKHMAMRKIEELMCDPLPRKIVVPFKVGIDFGANYASAK